MLLQKMNTVLVRHGKIFFGIFTFIIIICFVYYFSPGVSGDLFFRGTGSPNAKYGSFMDEEITYGDLEQARRDVSMFQMAQTGSRMNVSEQEAFQFAVLRKAADNFGMTLSERELAAKISSLPLFQTPDGAFSQAKYDDFRKAYLAPNGIGVQEFEAALADFCRVAKMLNEASDGIILSDAELEQKTAGLQETFAFRVVSFTPDAFLSSVSATDQEVEAEYKANDGAYLTDAKNGGLLAVAPYEITVKPVAAKQVSDYYEMNKDDYKTPDGKVKDFKEVSSSIRKMLETNVDKTKSLERMREFYKLLRDARFSDPDEYAKDPGKIFAEAAEKTGLKIIPIENVTSQTKPTADLDELTISRINSMKKIGTFSSALSRKEDSAVFLLTKREEPVKAPFQAVKEKVKQDLLKRKARAAMNETASAMLLKFRESKNPAADLEKIVADSHGTVGKKTELTREQMLFANDPALAAATDVKPGSLTQIIPTPNGAVAIFLEKRIPAAKEKIEAEKEKLRPILLDMKRSAAQRDYAEWIFSNCAISAPEAVERNRPDQPVQKPANPL